MRSPALACEKVSYLFVSHSGANAPSASAIAKLSDLYESKSYADGAASAAIPAASAAAAVGYSIASPA